MFANIRIKVSVAAIAFAAGVCVCCLSPASAAVLTWTLHNVTFDDGGTASGTFDYDAATNTFSNFAISMSGGTAIFFPSFEYSPGTAHTRAPLSTTTLSIDANSISVDQRTLFMQFEQPLTDNGGVSVVQNPDGLGGDSEFRTLVTSPPFGQRGFIAGGTVTAVPEPSSLAMLALGALAGGLLLLRRRRLEKTRVRLAVTQRNSRACADACELRLSIFRAPSRATRYRSKNDR